jgi:hypothetical protein
MLHVPLARSLKRLLLAWLKTGQFSVLTNNKAAVRCCGAVCHSKHLGGKAPRSAARYLMLRLLPYERW